jgi:hypothetical protein
MWILIFCQFAKLLLVRIFLHNGCVSLFQLSDIFLSHSLQFSWILDLKKVGSIIKTVCLKKGSKDIFSASSAV